VELGSGGWAARELVFTLHSVSLLGVRRSSATISPFPRWDLFAHKPLAPGSSQGPLDGSAVQSFLSLLPAASPSKRPPAV
jgi:hypothetical protein